MNFNYEVYPKIIPVGNKAEISIRGDEPAFKLDQTYSIHAFSKVNLWEETRLEVEADKDGFLRFCLLFQTQGEYLIEVYRTAEDKLTTEYFFAAHPDLARRKAYKGDMAVHEVTAEW